MHAAEPANLEWTLALPTGTVLLRNERPEDADFLATLFRSTAAPLPGVDSDLAESLMAMQYRSQVQSYRSAYPAAWLAVMEMAGEPFGRLVLERGVVSHIVDYALAPAVQGKGLGTAILTALLCRIDGPVRNTVLCTNAASLAMCRRAGFVVIAQRSPFVEMEWRPPVGVVGGEKYDASSKDTGCGCALLGSGACACWGWGKHSGLHLCAGHSHHTLDGEFYGGGPGQPLHEFKRQ